MLLALPPLSYVGPDLVELADGRIYFASNGQSLRGEQEGYIVPATDEHWAVLRAKR